MTSKSTWLLLAAAAALFAFVFFVERPRREEAARPPNRKVLPNLAPEKVTSVEVQTGGRAIRAERTEQGWRLTKPMVYPADAGRVETLLQGLAKWEWQTSIGPDELKEHPKADEEFGFAKPQFSLVLQAGGTTRRVAVGGNSVPGDEVYVRTGESNRIYVATSDVLNAVPTNADDWRDLAVVNLERTPFQWLRVFSASSSFEVKWDPVGGLWLMKSPDEARADTPKINELLGRLEALRVSRFVPDDAQAEVEASGVEGAAAAPQLRLTFGWGTNTVWDLEMGASPSNNPGLAYARRSNPSNLIEIARAPLLPWESDHTNFLDRHLISRSPSLITNIEVKGGDDFTVVKGTNGLWRVMGAETFAADARLMTNWLSAFTNIEVDIGHVEADLAQYGLDKPLLQYRLHFAGAAGESNAPQDNLAFGVSTNGKIFERRTDEKPVNALSAEQFERLPRISWELRDRSIWHFASNEVVAIDIHRQGQDRRWTKKEWTISPNYTNTLNAFAIQEALYRVGRLKAVYWRGNGDAHLERFGFAETDYRISFEVKQNGRMETNTVEFGKPAPPMGHPYASVTRDGRRFIFEFPLDLYDFLDRYLDDHRGRLPTR